MPKRVGFLYDKMLDKTFIRNVIVEAAHGKHKRRDVRRVLKHIDKYVDKTYDIIKKGNFVPSKPRERDVYDESSQKWRTIKVVPFWPDNVFHWLIVTVMKPVFMRGMHHWSCASIPGRGGKRVQKYIKRILKYDRKGTKYAGEMDVKGYYPSINIGRMMFELRRKIKDERFLDLIYSILRSCKGGLAIGYYICQWLANYFLEPLDHYIMGLDGVKYMTRYMDNITIFGPNKRKLAKARKLIAVFMRRRLGLKMKSNWQIYPVRKRMVSAVGYRFARTYIILRKRNFLRLTRQCRRAQKNLDSGRPVAFRQASGLLSRIGQLKHCDSHNVRVKYVDPIKVKRLKEVVRNESKRRLAA